MSVEVKKDCFVRIGVSRLLEFQVYAQVFHCLEVWEFQAANGRPVEVMDDEIGIILVLQGSNDR